MTTTAAASATALAAYDLLDRPTDPVCDDLAQLAAELCGTPVALVTLFDHDRQRFLARHGFDGDGTALDEALCAHAAAVDDLLVIPDLTLDPRTRTNRLVAGPPHVRFYAGAPLRTPEGVFVGTLCVVDFVPRPAGLSDVQARMLQILARQVLAQFELRRLLSDSDAAVAASDRENARLRSAGAELASGEAQWRGLFEGLTEGFMVGELIRDAAGVPVDWRHLEVNPAFLATLEQPADVVLGRTIRELAVHVADDLVPFVGRIVDTGEPATFNRQIGNQGRRFEGRAFPIGGDQFAVFFLDVTERTVASERQAALIAIGDQLRDLDRVEEMTVAVSRIVGETLKVTRAGYGRLDATREMVTIEPDWTAAGARSVAGRHRFADYGDLLQELLVGDPLIIDDVTIDPRTAADPGPMQGIDAAALVNIPVRERGRVVAVFIVHDNRPRHWTADEIVFLRDVADRLEVAITRLDIEHRRRIQNEELSHRLKNTLAMVQAIASQTLKPLTDRSVVETFDRRLTTLATAHGVLLASDWAAAPLTEVVRSVLDTAGQDGRVRLAGPPVALSPRAVLSISLLIHELATNAAKYGALSTPDGTIDVSWTISEAPRPIVTLEWCEHGGPPAVAPTRRGFGSRLINMGLVGTGGVALDYTPTGFVAKMAAPLDDLIKQ